MMPPVSEIKKSTEEQEAAKETSSTNLEELKNSVEGALNEYEKFVKEKMEDSEDDDFHQFSNKDKVLKTLREAGIKTDNLDIEISRFNNDVRNSDRDVIVGYDLKISTEGAVIFDKRYVLPGQTYQY